jgi:hypothetical protein
VKLALLSQEQRVLRVIRVSRAILASNRCRRCRASLVEKANARQETKCTAQRRAERLAVRLLGALKTPVRRVCSTHRVTGSRYSRACEAKALLTPVLAPLTPSLSAILRT